MLSSTLINMGVGGVGAAAIDVADDSTPITKIIIGAMTVLIQVLHYLREQRKDKKLIKSQVQQN